MNNEITVKQTIVLTDEDIDDIMVSALEGGIVYWCCKAEVVGKYRGDYASEQISRGGTLMLHDAEGEEGPWELTKEKFLNGFKLWYEDMGDEYGAVQVDGTVDCCHIDGEIADYIVQYALFGELIFG